MFTEMHNHLLVALSKKKKSSATPKGFFLKEGSVVFSGKDVFLLQAPASF